MLTTDQRGPGFPRTVDNPSTAPATGGDNTDIGAYEVPPPPPVKAGNALLINESCPPANGAIDPGESATVNLELTNNGNAPTSNLVATLQTSGGVMAPRAPFHGQLLTSLKAILPAVRHLLAAPETGQQKNKPIRYRSSVHFLP